MLQRLSPNRNSQWVPGKNAIQRSHNPLSKRESKRLSFAIGILLGPSLLLYSTSHSAAIIIVCDRIPEIEHFQCRYIRKMTDEPGQEKYIDPEVPRGSGVFNPSNRTAAKAPTSLQQAEKPPKQQRAEGQLKLTPRVGPSKSEHKTVTLFLK